MSINWEVIGWTCITLAFIMGVIALVLGFNSIHYFSRAFTQKYNMPPSEYAKTIYKSN